MREDIIDQKETEEVATERGKDEKEKNIEIVEAVEDSATEGTVVEEETEEASAEKTVAEEETEEASAEETVAEEVSEGEVVEKEPPEEESAEQIIAEEPAKEETLIEEPKESEAEGTVAEEKQEVPTVEELLQRALEEGLIREKKLKSSQDPEEQSQNKTEEKKESTQNKYLNIFRQIKIKNTSGKQKATGKKKVKRTKKQKQILNIVRVLCVIGILAFFCIPDREKPVVADEITEENEVENATKKLQIPTVKRAEREINKRCESYRSQVEQMAARYGIPQYVDLLMALMMQESGGRGLDIMQSSEGAFNTRYPKVPNGITDISYSIECGVQELKEALVKAGVESPDDIPRIEQALQAYNFGIRYLDFSEEKGVTEWNREIAAEYARIASSGRTRDEHDTKTMGKWDYGDQYYPEHVLRYYAIPVTDE